MSYNDDGRGEAPPLLMEVPALRAELVRRSCEYCGREYEKPHKVSWARWLDRRFCDRKCARRGRFAETAIRVRKMLSEKGGDR